jgi:hypothetical protein
MLALKDILRSASRMLICWLVVIFFTLMICDTHVADLVCRANVRRNYAINIKNITIGTRKSINLPVLKMTF